MRNMERRIKSAFENASPDVFDAVLSRVNALKGEETVMTENRIDNATTITKEKSPSFRPSWVRRFAAIAACLVLLVCGGIGLKSYNLNHRVESIVDLDVNPSIEIRLNQKERVIDVTPLNDDAKAVLGDMDFKGADLNLSLNAIIGSMLRHGYITDARNSILVSVDNSDAARGQELQKRITEEINTILGAASLEGAVLSQTVTNDDTARSVAETYGISVGKAKLIIEIVAVDDRYTAEELAALSINELNLILSSRSLPLPGIQSEGQASDKGYIGADKAKEIALSHAGVSEADIYNLEIEMDYEQNQMVYDIEFDCGGYEYDYDINAITGAVVKSQKERDNDWSGWNATGNTPSQTPSQPSNNANAGTSADTYIGKNKAKAIALNHAGVSEAEIRNFECELDRENGVMVYEIEFDAGSYEYSYEINATTGEVVKAEKEKDDDRAGRDAATTQSTTQPPAPSQAGNDTGTASVSEDYIGTARAKSIALNHAGVSESEIRNYRCELDKEHGVMVYEIEFDAGSYEYSYEINATTGAVIDYEKELDD